MGTVVDRPGAFRRPRREPWQRSRGLSTVLEAWNRSSVSSSFHLDETLPPHDASARAFPEALPPAIVAALGARGVCSLFSHQADAFELARAGRDFVVATPTASGKSLCFHLPILEKLTREPDARALYLFPTKALARDQETSLRSLLGEAGLAQGAITYDGDTPGDARRAARERTGILLTNPDMLHAGILPHHAAWARFFAKLSFVVIDELHTYRGVFGSHLANVLRRLDRIARFHGSSPVFLFASATIGNPRAHAERMLGRPVEVIDESGAPRGPRHVVVYNPPIVNAELGLRASYLKSAVRLTADLVRADVQTLVFGQSRTAVEVMLKYLRDRLAKDGFGPQSIQAYRGGYLPETRRRIEGELREGAIRCVVATNALELGIDVGSLDAVVCAGYPGTVADLWQRFGRAGRRQEPSLALLVTSSAPIDQYVARSAKSLIGAPVEEARIDPDNVEILLQHLKCAAFELPFDEGERFGDVPADSVGDALGFLAEREVVHAVRGPSGKTRYHWATDSYPASHVSLRSASWDNFVVIDVEANRTIAEMDFRSTHTMLHEQAIYQHEGEQYQVERLDFENHKAFVRKVAPDYYTTAMTHTKVTVLTQDERAVAKGPRVDADVGLGDVRVVEKVVGYKKIKFHTHENVGYGDVRLPEMDMHTTSVWLTLPEAYVAARPEPRPVVVDALRGLAVAMHTIAAVGLMADPADLGHTIGDRHEPDAPPAKGEGAGPGFDPTIFLYDHVPGGIGLAPRLFDERVTLLRRTRELIVGCGCEEGCPSCIGPEAGVPSVLADASSRKAIGLSILDDLGAASVC